MVGDYFCPELSLLKRNIMIKKMKQMDNDERYVICDISKLVLWKKRQKSYIIILMKLLLMLIKGKLFITLE